MLTKEIEDIFSEGFEAEYERVSANIDAMLEMRHDLGLDQCGCDWANDPM